MQFRIVAHGQAVFSPLGLAHGWASALFAICFFRGFHGSRFQVKNNDRISRPTGSTAGQRARQRFLAAKNTNLPSLNLYPFPTRRLNRSFIRFRRLQIIPTRVILLIGYSFRGLRSVFYAGDQIVVYVLVPAVKMPLVDYLAAGTKTYQIGSRLSPCLVVVEEGVNHRMP